MRTTNEQQNVESSHLEFCKKKNKSITEELTCKQDLAHKSIIENPLGFIIFYVIIVIFFGCTFSTYPKKFKNKKEKKISSLHHTIFIFICLHAFLVFVILNLAHSFSIKKIGNSFFI